ALDFRPGPAVPLQRSPWLRYRFPPHGPPVSDDPPGTSLFAFHGLACPATLWSSSPGPFPVASSVGTRTFPFPHQARPSRATKRYSLEGNQPEIWDLRL